MPPPSAPLGSVLLTEAQTDLYRAEDLIVGPAARARELLACSELAIALFVALGAEPEEPVEQQHGEAGADAHRPPVPADRAVDGEQDHEAGQHEEGGKAVAEQRDHQVSE